jgi:hypothetical protein
VPVIYQILIGIVIAAVSSWITVQLSMKQFRLEWLWKIKADTYSSIIEALHHSKKFDIAHISSLEQNQNLSKEVEEKLRLLASEGQNVIEKTFDMGSFILSPDAIVCLEQYLKEIEDAEETNNFYNYLDNDLAAIKNCLRDIIPIAKKDLKINWLLKI